jgi:competence protein ComEA
MPDDPLRAEARAAASSSETSLRARAGDLVAALRLQPRRAAAAAVAAGVVAGVLWWFLRPPAVTPPEQLLPVVTTGAATVSSSAPSGSAPASPVTSTVVVHVSGAVVRPGVLHLPVGTRVIDAVDAAGGTTPDADTDRVNLATLLSDGGRVHVPRVGESAPPVASGSSPAATGPLDLNQASAQQLEELPGIGPATAAAIVEHRERHGPFASVDALGDVSGIGDAKLAQLRDLVRV